MASSPRVGADQALKNNSEDYEEANPQDNWDNTRTQYGQFGGRIMPVWRCPSAGTTEVIFSNWELENLRKANYAACYGGGTFAHSLPTSANPDKKMLGVFGVVQIQKYPVEARLGTNLGTRAGAINIAQADASRCGGISEVVKVGRLAAAHGCRLAPHSWSDAVAITANAHVVAALANGVTVEVDQTGNPFVDRPLGEPLKVVDGHLTLSDAPGLGIEIDEAILKDFVLPPGTLPDGSYSDMAFGPAFAG